MTIYVFSDSHGWPDNITGVIEKEGVPDLLIFLGDGEGDLEKVRAAYPQLEIADVRGNCDFDKEAPIRRVIEAGGIKIFATHGHYYDVKSGINDRLIEAAKAYAPGVQLVLYGHTHTQYLGQEQGVTVFNPGSCATGWQSTYGVIYVKNGQFSVEPRTIEKSKSFRLKDLFHR